MAKFQKLHQLSTDRREAWRKWTLLTSDGDRSERQAAWLAVVKADEDYHNEIRRLLEAGTKPDDLRDSVS